METTQVSRALSAEELKAELEKLLGTSSPPPAQANPPAAMPPLAQIQPPAAVILETSPEPVIIPEPAPEAKPLAFSLANSDVSDKAKFIERDIYKTARNLYKNTNMPILAQGPTGSGKTRMWHEIAKEHNQEVTRICLDDTVSLREWQGDLVLAKQENCTVTQFVPGIITEAIQKPGMIILDEMSRMSSNKISPLNQLLDSGKMYVKGYGWVNKHADCRIVGTLNPHTGMYAGTHKLDASLINRFLCIEIPQFNESEMLLLVPEGDNKLKLVQFYLETQKAIKDGNLDFEFSIRNISYILQGLASGLNLREAIESGILNSVELVSDIDQRNLVLNIATASFGTAMLT